MRRLAILVLLLGLLAGCGDDAASAADTPPVCDSADAVRVTVEHIRNTNVSENGLSQLRPLFTQLRDDIAQLVTDAQAQFGAQADALRTAAENFGAALQGAEADPGAASFTAVRATAGALRGTAQDLAAALTGTC
ncbi:hypothetical protein Ade02nite_79740 [Paractinoplanes deccanensis]|uniref:Lipoprotein n=1 Tax=Paractinoplanes deccanensis TaxID=113561 RepID=A0ABQ3YH66_9ACTN|nr:hypothetical protein [Actinoplanes deccanensis]GID79333.1 hypothetical protein Ade02nite_79740 [Actinoplanes deccanensis]